ncbi:MAG: hypothetical protein JW839_15525, partial [Candidatus Lokiarchaeota archaeon]|nr:hypothetical protein [Candidatus Lokiarchaeota archaeon]
MGNTIKFRRVDLVTSEEGERFGRVGGKLELRQEALVIMTAPPRPENVAPVTSYPLDQIKDVYTRGFVLKGRFGVQERIDVLVILAPSEVVMLAPRLLHGPRGEHVAGKYDGNRARELAAEIKHRLPADANRPDVASPQTDPASQVFKGDAALSSPGGAAGPTPTRFTTPSRSQARTQPQRLEQVSQPPPRSQVQPQRHSHKDIEFDRVDRILSWEGERLRASFGTLSLRTGS